MTSSGTDTTEHPPIVYIIDDDPAMREAIADLMSSIALSAKTFSSPDEFMQTSLPEAPCCLVLDIRMPGISGLEFQRKLNERGSGLPVIFITGHGDIPMSVQAMKAGAIDFLCKPFRDQDLLDAIQLGIEKDRLRRAALVRHSQLKARYERLSEGEREVLPLLIQGLLNKQIAANLHVSEITVKVRRAQIMKKMEAESLPSLVRMYEALNQYQSIAE